MVDDHSARRFARHRGLVCERASRKTLAIIGAGGVAGAAVDVAAMGLDTIFLVDPARVEPENIGASNFVCADSEAFKVDALERLVKAANPSINVVKYAMRDDELPVTVRDAIWSQADIVWSMTDDVHCHARCNQLAFKYRKDTLFGAMHGDNRAWDVIGSLFPETHQGSGCYHCYARERIEAHQAGRERPAFFPSHRLSASAINLAICWITIGLAHYRAGSDLWIARYGEEFARRPCLLGLLDLEFWTGERTQFGNVPFQQRMFATRLLDRPAHRNWTCPSCGRR